MDRLGLPLRLLGAWYRTPVGLAYLAVLAAAVVVAFAAGPEWALVVLLPGLATVVPYKIYREGAIREERLFEVLSEAHAAVGQAVAEQGAAGAREVREDLAAAMGDTAARFERAAGELAASRDDIAELRREQQSAGRAIAELRAGADALREELQRDHAKTTAEAVAQVQHDLAGAETRMRHDLAENVAKMRSVVDEATTRAERLVRSEAGARRLALARLDARTVRPDGALVIVTPQRSGSTWLFDMLRCHPDVRMMPTSDLFAALGGTGRRYPLHLSDGPDADVHIEALPGVGAAVPGYGPPAGWEHATAGDVLAIEKLHPMALGYDTGAFLRKLDEVGAGLPAGVQVLYLVRDAAGAIGSFLAYQQRSPRWHGGVHTSEVLDLYAGSYEMIGELVERRPGLVVTYADLQEPVPAMAGLYRAVDPALDEQAASELAAHAVAATGRERRHAGQTGPFIGDAGPRPSPHTAELWDDPDAAEAAIRRCEELYAAISAATS